MNFTMKFKENTKIFTIKNTLRDRHGRMDDFRICFKAFTESNEVKNDMLTLLGEKDAREQFILLHYLCVYRFVTVYYIS